MRCLWLLAAAWLGLGAAGASAADATADVRRASAHLGFRVVVPHVLSVSTSDARGHAGITAHSNHGRAGAASLVVTTVRAQPADVQHGQQRVHTWFVH